MTPSPLTGFICLSAYLLLSPAKDIATAAMLGQVDRFALSFSCFGIMVIFYALFAGPGLRRIYRLSIQHRLWVGTLNLSTAFCWLSFFSLLKSVQPFVAIGLINSLGLVFSLALEGLFKPASKAGGASQRGFDSLAMLGVMLGLGLVTWGEGFLSRGSQDWDWLTPTAAILGGFCLSLTALGSRQLSAKGLVPRELMSLRYLLLVIVSGAFVNFNELRALGEPLMLLKVLALAFMGMVLPTHFLQTGMVHVDPFVTTLFMSCAPVVALGIQALVGLLHTNAYSLVGTLCCVGCAILGAYHRQVFRPARA